MDFSVAKINLRQGNMCCLRIRRHVSSMDGSLVRLLNFALFEVTTRQTGISLGRLWRLLQGVFIFGSCVFKFTGPVEAESVAKQVGGSRLQRNRLLWFRLTSLLLDLLVCRTGRRGCGHASTLGK